MNGYAATLASSVTGNRSGSFPGPVKTQVSAAQSPFLQVSGITVSGVIYEDLMPILNHTADNMRGFLKEIFEVHEDHTMMAKLDSYNSIANLVSCVEDIYNNTYGSLFKFETKLGDEYEANVVVAQYCE